MGVAVSGWRLAKAVSSAGQLGVVSGTALDTVMIRKLQDGDPGGHYRRALSVFPIPRISEKIIHRFFKKDGRAKGESYTLLPLPNLNLPLERQEMLIAANFAEVLLAKEGHEGRVGINYLEKIQIPTLPSLYGAILAGVDYVLVGAGIPTSFPGILDRLSQHLPVELKVDVLGDTGDGHFVEFDPKVFFPHHAPKVCRPKFLPIVSSAVLASSLLRRATGSIEGFIVEHHSAGGHNAPPRGGLQLSENGEPVYGERDIIEFEKFVKLGKPFWLAGTYGSREKLEEARSLGATGIQLGTLFAYSDESGILSSIKSATYKQVMSGNPRIHTDARASPTGFPFKVVSMEGSLSESEVYQKRKRICDLGYLRSAYLKENGEIGYRCPAEPVDDFVRKGGVQEDTLDRKCLCNGLMATVGLGQTRSVKGEDVYEEPALLTSGDDLMGIRRFFKPDAASYTAMDVLKELGERAT